MSARSTETRSTRRLGVWIDARDSRSRLDLFGMSLLERQLRSVLEAGLEPARVWILPQGEGGAELGLPADLLARLPIRFETRVGSLREALARAAATAGGPILALAADSVVDPRLLRRLADAPGSLVARGGRGDERAVVVRLEGPPPSTPEAPHRLEDLAESWLEAGALAELPLAAVPDYLPRLRRSLPAYCFRIRSAADRDHAERFLFESNYKGSTDFLTKHVYPPLVWRLVGPLARRRVHPNWLSALNALLAAAAIPLFATAWWVPGLVLAYTMSVLDSVDGKLARLTFRASRLGHVLDHGLDVVHPPFWYAAWAWPLGGSDPGSPVFQAALWLAALYFLDRIVTQIFTWSTGRSIHAWTALDVRMRTFVSRRNVNLALFTAGLAVGAPVAAFAAVVAWQAATLLFHAARLGQAWWAAGPDEPVGEPELLERGSR